MGRRFFCLGVVTVREALTLVVMDLRLVYVG